MGWWQAVGIEFQGLRYVGNLVGPAPIDAMQASY